MDINIEPNYCFCKGIDVVLFWERKAFIQAFFLFLLPFLLPCRLSPSASPHTLLNNFLRQSSCWAASESSERKCKEHSSPADCPMSFLPQKKNQWHLNALTSSKMQKQPYSLCISRCSGIGRGIIPGRMSVWHSHIASEVSLLYSITTGTEKIVGGLGVLFFFL